MFALDDGRVIDATVRGNVARYCELQYKWPTVF